LGVGRVRANAIIQQRKSDSLHDELKIFRDTNSQGEIMQHYWICHWQKCLWRNDIHREDEPVENSASNSFTKCGVTVGDFVYIISLIDGYLYLGGRMQISLITTRDEACRIYNSNNLYPAKEWIIDENHTSTILNFNRRLSPELSKRLRFVTKKGPRGLAFVSENRLDPQATRRIRELTPESAEIFDRIIEVTDSFPRDGELITVTDEILAGNWSPFAKTLPEEVQYNCTFSEGSVRQILVNRYERDPQARKKCIEHYGAKCVLCGFDFSKTYDESMVGFIHVHHLQSLASVDQEHEVDPIRDLRPVCPNCHAAIHFKCPPYSLEEIANILQKDRQDARERA
jgi:hypothetical protein